MIIFTNHHDSLEMHYVVDEFVFETQNLLESKRALTRTGFIHTSNTEVELQERQFKRELLPKLHIF